MSSRSPVFNYGQKPIADEEDLQVAELSRELEDIRDRFRRKCQENEELSETNANLKYAVLRSFLIGIGGLILIHPIFFALLFGDAFDVTKHISFKFFLLGVGVIALATVVNNFITLGKECLTLAKEYIALKRRQLITPKSS